MKILIKILIGCTAVVMVSCTYFLSTNQKPHETPMMPTLLEESTRFATEKALDLKNTGYREHTNSDGCDIDCRADRGLSRFQDWVGENLYKGPCDLRIAIDMWEKSPKHKEILDHRYNNGVLIITPFGNGCYINLVVVED